MLEEIWKPVVGYEGLYEVSNTGKVRSVARCIQRRNGRKLTCKSKELKQFLDSRGYLCVTLFKTKLKVHRLVATAFIPNECPEKTHVNHIDGNKTNNHVSNLEWCTPKQNTLHAWKTGLMKPSKGAKNGRAKLTDKEVAEIKKKYFTEGLKQAEIAKDYGVSQVMVSRIVSGKNWTHLGFDKLKGVE